MRAHKTIAHEAFVEHEMNAEAQLVESGLVQLLLPGPVYRAIAWVKAEPGVRVAIEAHDAVDPLTGRPSNSGDARADLAAGSIGHATGDILASGVEAAGDGWAKAWVELCSKDGEVFVTIGLLAGRANRSVFNAAGQEITLEGFEISQVGS
jgi:hypothetical protein